MPVTAMMVGSVAAPVIGGMMGANASAGDRAAAQEMYKKAFAQYDGIDIPDIEKQKLALKSLEVQGIIAPQQETAIQQGNSAMGGITTDPRLAQAQMNALDTMSKMGTQGLTAIDIEALNATRRKTSGDANARSAQILQNMAQRGVGGSGMELAAKLQASQQAADLAGQESDRTNSMAQQRMLAAQAASGSLGGQMRSQEFGEKSQKAQADDVINQFNASLKAGAQTRNVAGSNAAQYQNLAERQRIADSNVGTSNAEQQYNSNLLQQQFGNKMGLASARANSAVGAGNNFNQQAQQTAQQFAGMGAGVGQGLMGGAGMMNSNNEAKEDRDSAEMVGMMKMNEGGFVPGYYEGGFAAGYEGTEDVSGYEAYKRRPEPSNMPSGDTPRNRGEEDRAKNALQMIMDRQKASQGMAQGGEVAPGYNKGKLVPGDSEKNDVIDAKLSPGEIVIPRSHAITPHLAKAFIDHLYGKK